MARRLACRFRPADCPAKESPGDAQGSAGAVRVSSTSTYRTGSTLCLKRTTTETRRHGERIFRGRYVVILRYSEGPLVPFATTVEMFAISCCEKRVQEN